VIDSITAEGNYVVTYTEYQNTEEIPESRVRPKSQQTIDDVSEKAFKPGDYCLAVFPQDGEWYNAVVVGYSGNKVQVSFLEFSALEELPESNLRPIQQQNSILPVQETPSTSSSSHGWKVGDACEACFSEDGVWYEAVIDKISPDGKLFTVTYTEYGNIEDVEVSSLRPRSGTTSTAPKWKVGDICEGCFTEDDVWYTAKIEEVYPETSSAFVTYTEYGNQETISFDRIRPQSEQEAPAAPVFPWKVGDLCEGCFTEDGVWYAAKIEEVYPETNSVFVTYTEYGNQETIPITSVRPLSENTHSETTQSYVEPTPSNQQPVKVAPKENPWHKPHNLAKTFSSTPAPIKVASNKTSSSSPQPQHQQQQQQQPQQHHQQSRGESQKPRTDKPFDPNRPKPRGEFKSGGPGRSRDSTNRK